MTVSQLVKEINNSNLSIEDLRILNQLVVRKIKAEQKVEALRVSTTLSEGDVVRVNHPKLAGRTGKVIKIKRTKCDIHFAGLGGYTVPMSIVKAV